MASSSRRAEGDLEDMGEEQDEKWDDNYRRALRKKLREHLTDTLKRREEITLPDELLDVLKKSDDLFADIRSSREAVLDAETLRTISEYARQQVDTTTTEVINFDSVAFAEKLVTSMGGRRQTERLDWVGLGGRARKAFKTAPSPSFLYGALVIQPLKKREKRVQRRKAGESSGAATRPKELVNFDEEEESTTKDVAHILQYARCACEGSEDGRVHYFSFLVDPESFSHTVENMFHLSFLIKEGRAGIHIGDDGQPYIHLPEEVNEVGQSTKSTKNQVVISLSMDDWKRAIEKFDITESYIPHRTD